MIQGFVGTLQQDFQVITSCFRNRSKDGKIALDDKQAGRVGMAAVRAFAVLGMALSAVVALGAFSATTAIGALFHLAVAAALYAVSHDVFIMARNSEKGLLSLAFPVGAGLINDLKDWWQGRKTENDPFRHPLSDGTLLRPMWDQVLAS